MPFANIMNLRDANETVNMLPWQLEELRKCALDPMYFINTYLYITTKDHGIQLFKMWDFQKEAIKKFHKHRFTVLKFPRQCGKCVHPDEIIYIKNSNGDEMEFTISEFFELLNEDTDA